MSRWQTEFEQHPFQSYWKGLQDEVPLLEVDDQTIQTSLDEVARLKRVIAYLGSLIASVDAEMTPKSVWDNFQQQAEQCLAQVRSYASNRSIGHIQNANTNADNLLSYVKPYLVLPQEIVAALGASSRAFQDQVLQFVDAVRDQSNDVAATIQKNFETIQAHLVAVNADASQIEALKVNLIDGTPERDSVKKVVLDLETAISAHSVAVKAYHDQLLVGGATPSTKVLIDAAFSEIVSGQVRIQKAMKLVEDQIESLNEFHTKIFGEADAEGNVNSGLEFELDTRTNRLKQLETEQVIKHKALFEKIEGLLPGATSAGLATAYKDLKVSFDDQIKKYTEIFFMSVAAIPVVALIASVKEFSILQLSISFADVTTIDAILRLSVLKLPFILPLVWLAVFASMRRSQYERLQQEYAHKEALAKSYDSYRQQIDQLKVADNDSLKQELISKAIDAIAFNASNTLNGKHREQMPLERALEIVTGDKGIGALLDRLKGIFPRST
jgi:cell division protein FtsB